MSHDFVPSRRQLIAGGAVLTAVLPGASIAKALNTKPLGLQDMDDWQAQVGKEFAVNGTPMRLVAVKPGSRQPYGMARKHNFTTVFEVRGNAVPVAGLQQVSHPELGQASLYMEPSATEDGTPRLRASFS